MSSALKKSNAPLFVAFSPELAYDDPSSTACTKDEFESYLSHVSSFDYKGYEHGEIACELVPLGFVYKDGSGNLVDGEVSQDALVEMLHMQSLIYDGVMEPPATPCAPDAFAASAFSSAETDSCLVEETPLGATLMLSGYDWDDGEGDAAESEYMGAVSLMSILEDKKGYSPLDMSLADDGTICLSGLPASCGYDAVAISPALNVGHYLYDAVEVMNEVPLARF